jgi:predicted component of type VI protein secretion system
MKTKIKIDRPFLEKFTERSIYLTSYDELCKSVINEIGNILSSKLKLNDENSKSFKIPFLYGVRDLQSIGISDDNIENFKRHCEKIILELEPRLSRIEFDKVNVNKEEQSLKVEITCHLKYRNKKFEAVI